MGKANQKRKIKILIMFKSCASNFTSMLVSTPNNTVNIENKMPLATSVIFSFLEKWWVFFYSKDPILLCKFNLRKRFYNGKKI